MEITHVFAGVPVSDAGSAHDWYERFFGRPPDMRPREGEAVWRLSPRVSVYVVEDPGAAGRGQLTIAVGALEAALAELDARGIGALPGPEGGPAPRSALATDLDGNTVKLFEDEGAP